MRLSTSTLLLLLSAALLLLSSTVDAGKKKGKKTQKKKVEDKDLFDSKTLKCLVCQNLADEFLSAVHMIDPAKMIDTGTFRINGQGEQKRSVVRIRKLYENRAIDL